MYASIREVLENVLVELIPDLRSIEDERVIQEVLRSRLSLAGMKFDRRVVLSSEGIPNVEVDLLGQGVAIEVKVNPRFHDGIGQVAAISELFGLEPILLQIWKEVREEVVGAVKRLADRCKFHAFIVDLKGGEVISV